MRTIDSIIIHCSATPGGKDFTAIDIDRWHRQRGFDSIGYHYVIRLNGTIENGRPVVKPGAHCIGWNQRSIGICYIGGLNTSGHAADTRTPAQKRSMKQLIDRLQKEYPHIQTIIGHRDTSPDLNGNRCIEPQEYIKDCPCFDVRTWLRSISLCTVCAGLFCLTASCGSHKSVVRISEQELSSAVNETVQTKQTHELEQIVSKQLNDSSSDKNLLIDEYLEKTILIRRKKKNESDANRQISHKAESNTKTDTIYVERRTTDDRSTTLQKQQDKKRSSGKNTVFFWITGVGVLAGGGYLIAVRYRKVKEGRQKNS